MANSTFAERWKSAREAAGLKMNELDRAIGQSSGYTSRVESGDKNEASILVVSAAARILGVRLAWLVDGEGSRDAAEGADPSAGGFMLKLRRLPKLEEWIESNPERFTVSQLARAMAFYDENKPASRSDGQPMTGWGDFIENALRRPTLKGDVAAAEKAERATLSKSARKRLQPSSK